MPSTYLEKNFNLNSYRNLVETKFLLKLHAMPKEQSQYIFCYPFELFAEKWRQSCLTVEAFSSDIH